MARPERFERPTLWFVGRKARKFLFINSHLKRLPAFSSAQPSHSHVTANGTGTQTQKALRTSDNLTGRE